MALDTRANPRRPSGPFFPTANPRIRPSASGGVGAGGGVAAAGRQRSARAGGPQPYQVIGVSQIPLSGYGGGGVGASIGGDGGGGVGAGDGGPGFTTEAHNDPRLDRYADLVEGRINDPEGSTGRAIDRATGKIRDATEGRRAALRSMMSARGVLSGTSIPELTDAALADAEGRQVAGAAADISLARERDNDSVLLGALGAMRAPGDAAARDRQMGADIWAQQEQLRLARRRQELDQYMTQLDMLSRLGGSL